MIQQTISQLSYQFVSGATDLRPLRILASRRFAWHAWSITAHVLGASHAVVLERGPVRLTELLTCAPPPGAHPILISMPLQESVSDCIEAEGLRCSIRITEVPLEDGDSLAGCFSEDCRLDVAFPAHSGNTPVTRVGWRVTPSHLSIESVHSYPEEGRAVRSSTTFSAREMPFETDGHAQ